MKKSVELVGWSTILASVFFIFSNFFSLLSDPMDQFKLILQSFPQARASLDSMSDLFLFNRIWSVYMIIYFMFVLVGAVQFIRYLKIGRTILEIACWVGIISTFVDSVLSYTLLKSMQSAISKTMGNMGISFGNLNSLGTITVVLGLLLWVIPSIGMILYLRNPELNTRLK
jgi:hypothetical protein